MVGLEVANFMRINAVSITPTGDLVVIGGQNESGKSSVLDALWSALSWQSHPVAEPVRRGAETATVDVDLGELKVRRTWKAGGGSSITVKTATGGSVSSPAETLKRLISKVCFDPMIFARAEVRAQVEMLTAVIDLPFDPAKLAADRKTSFDLRTDINRDLKRIQGQVEASDVPLLPKFESISAGEHVTRLQHAEQQLQKLTTLLSRRVELVAELAGVDAQLEGAPPVETLRGVVDGIHRQLADLDAINSAAHEQQALAKLVMQRVTLAAAAQAQTDYMADLDSRRLEAMAGVAMPVAGLAIDDERGVTIDGIPFVQCSSAQRIRASVAIAAATDPKLRVMHIRDGSLLDDDSMRIVAQLAEDMDIQVFVERVGRDPWVGVVIEDGKVAE